MEQQNGGEKAHSSNGQSLRCDGLTTGTRIFFFRHTFIFTTIKYTHLAMKPSNVSDISVPYLPF
jgi:hypothetical protein